MSRTLPDTALQRTAALAFSYRRAGLTATGSVTAGAPATQPGTCRAFASLRSAPARASGLRSLRFWPSGVATFSMTRSILAMTVSLALLGCTQDSRHSSGLPRIRRDQTIGHWDNPYRGNARLAGVDVAQFGECPHEHRFYEGKHPCEVSFFFWDGRVRSVCYSPDGTIVLDEWWSIKAGDILWDFVDFSHGSDPKFLHHADPRKKPESHNA